MNDYSIPLPNPLKLMIKRALVLTESMLNHTHKIYPFAAIYEAGRVGCLFGYEDIQQPMSNSDIIERLQWRIIDNTVDNEAYSILVYAAHIRLESGEEKDAIAITCRDPEQVEQMVVYPYTRMGEKVLIADPMIEH